MSNRSFLEFLQALNDLTTANIDFILKEPRVNNFKVDKTYLQELEMIRDLINSFKFDETRST